jgi:serine-type D-Ala-D-Ala carboxypeptidase/endopeptidase (penicillin-binding protein 4)
MSKARGFHGARNFVMIFRETKASLREFIIHPMYNFELNRMSEATFAIGVYRVMSRKITICLMLLFLSSHIGVTQSAAKAQTQTPIPVAPASIPKPICPAQVSANIDAVVNRTLFSRARWGILVQPLGSNQTLYNRDAQKYFTPASNTKLLTTAAALQQLGTNFRIRTSVYQDSAGVLRVVGRGDPSFSDRQLQALAKQLKAKGINQINQLIADDSYFQGDIVHPSWQWEDLYSDYGAPVSSLNLNQNVFGIRIAPQAVGKPIQVSWTDGNEARLWQLANQSVTVGQNQDNTLNITRDLSGRILRVQGQLPANVEPFLVSIPVVDPNYYFLRRFRSALAAERIILGQTSVGTAKNQQELAAVQSPALSELLMEINQNSNNLYAESLLRAIAFKQPRKPNQFTVDAGLEVLKTTLTQLGVDPMGYVLVDGSGLSRRNLISPLALVQTLQGMAKSPAASVFRVSLPVAGKSGTLKFRFRDTPAEGIVQAKTGTMTGVVSLSGYVNAPKYQPMVFSIIVNQTEQSARVVRQAMDEIVVTLAQLQKC